MQDMGLGAGLAALAFWGFIAVAVLGGIWDGIRKREAQQETLRRLIESGQHIDKEVLDTLLLQSEDANKRHDRDFRITALWILPVSAGMAVFGLIFGQFYPKVLGPLLGVSGLLATLGIGYLVAAKIAGRWYPADDESKHNLL
jgi:hypothetical protein